MSFADVLKKEATDSEPSPLLHNPLDPSQQKYLPSSRESLELGMKKSASVPVVNPGRTMVKSGSLPGFNPSPSPAPSTGIELNLRPLNQQTWNSSPTLGEARNTRMQISSTLAPSDPSGHPCCDRRTVLNMNDKPGSKPVDESNKKMDEEKKENDEEDKEDDEDEEEEEDEGKKGKGKRIRKRRKHQKKSRKPRSEIIETDTAEAEKI